MARIPDGSIDDRAAAPVGRGVGRRAAARLRLFRAAWTRTRGTNP